MRQKIRQKSLWQKGAIATIALSLITGLAYALLQTQAGVLGSTITTSSANLLISTDGVHYDRSIPGFNFRDALPGGYAAPAGGYPIYLENAGNTDLDLGLAVTGPPGNPDLANLSKINFDLTDMSGHSSPRSLTLQSLIDGQTPIGGDLAPGAYRKYALQVALQPDADQGAAVSGIDLTFAGIARDPNDPNQAQ